MDWIDWALVVCGIAAAFGIGFYCGYVKDKKEVREMYLESREYYDKARKSLSDAIGSLDKAEADLREAYQIRQEAKAHLDEAKEMICQWKAEDEDSDSL